jgi:microcystin-dependent protein
MKKKRISAILITILIISLMLSLNIVQTFAIAGEQYLGEVHLMAFYYPPQGWALCRGQILNVNQNQALFALIGTKFGGNGTTTFALPNLEAAEPKVGETGYGMHYCIALTGIYPSHP